MDLYPSIGKYRGLCGRIYVCDCIRIEIPASYCRLRHLSLCASRTTAVSEKISDCQSHPNLSAKLPNISPLFLDENSTTVPDCYICGSRHTRLFSNWPPFQRLRTIIISVWIGTDIMNRPLLRTTFYDIQGGFRLQYSHYQFGCTNVHGKVCSRHL